MSSSPLTCLFFIINLKKSYDVYGEKTLTERQCQNWFTRFRFGDFDLTDAPRSGRPTEVDDGKIKAMIENNRRSTTREIAEKLNISHTCVERHSKHEKWVVYDNVMRKRSWNKRDEPAQSTSKADIHQKKVMLSVWWDFKGIVYFELLPRNQTINSNVYYRQLTKLDKEIKEKRPELATRKGVIFHEDKARPHTSLVTRKKLFELGWEVMPHPPYSPLTLHHPIIIYSVQFKTI